MRHRQLLLLVTAAITLGACTRPVDEQLLGAYRLEDARLVSVRESTPGTLRLRVYQDGTTRRFTRDDGQWRAGPGIAPDFLSDATLTFTPEGLVLTRAQGTLRAMRLELGQRHAVLELDVPLSVRLTLPPGPGPHPAVVLLQGSGDDAATRTYGNVDFFSANGIAAAVYDKRGTGRSGGSHVHDFHRLAADAIAVIEWVAAQPGIDPERIGVTGYSQGGWIGPLAAAGTPLVDFVIANYGMINSPRDEERIETVARLARRGHQGAALEQVAELSNASVDVMAAGFRHWASYDAVAERYRNEPFMDDLDGTTIGAFERWPHWLVSLIGPHLGPAGIDWDHTSDKALDVLAERGVPVVWRIAADDRSAPPERTLLEVRRRMAAGEPHELQVYPATDHGFLRYVEEADGERRYGNYHPDSFVNEVDWVQRLTRSTPRASP